VSPSQGSSHATATAGDAGEAERDGGRGLGEGGAANGGVPLTFNPTARDEGHGGGGGGGQGGGGVMGGWAKKIVGGEAT
jgi:hypothetical protein